MSHDHSAGGHHHHGREGDSAGLRAAFFLNLAFTAVEIAGGLWTNSVAILTDAVHDLGDCLSIGLSWFLQKLSRRDANAVFTYGYRRFSVLGALITGVVLLGGVAYMAFEAVSRLMRPEEVYAPGMIALAVLGIIANGAAVWRTRKGTSLNERVVTWHLLEDTLGWGAVLIGSIVMAIWNVPILDPLLSLLISLFILWNVGRNLLRVGRVFLQVAPAGFDRDAFCRRIEQLPRVRSTHHTHVWSLDGEQHVLSMHVAMDGQATRDDIVRVKEQVRAEAEPMKFRNITVDVELAGEPCSTRSPDEAEESGRT